MTLPSGYHLTRGARSRIQTTSSSENVTITNGEKDLSGNTVQFEVGFENANARRVAVNAARVFLPGRRRVFVAKHIVSSKYRRNRRLVVVVVVRRQFGVLDSNA